MCSTRATALDAAWDPAQMNFVETMRSAGPGNAVYPTQQAAIQSVGLALFFLDRMVKDKKLGIPLGLDPTYRSAGRVAAGDLLRIPYAGRSKANMRANLDGVRRIVEGCGPGNAGLGFDDLLESVGAADSAGRLRAALAAAEAALAAIGEPDLPRRCRPTGRPCRRCATRSARSRPPSRPRSYTLLGFEESVIPTDTDS